MRFSYSANAALSGSVQQRVCTEPGRLEGKCCLDAVHTIALKSASIGKELAVEAEDLNA